MFGGLDWTWIVIIIMIKIFHLVFNPFEHILQSKIAHLPPDHHTLGVVVVEELVARFIITLQCPPVLTQVEHPGVDSNPVEIARQLLTDVRLASGWQSNLVIIKLF